jgi:(p)ppGpp synthase/HD superfamily hydrolase
VREKFGSRVAAIVERCTDADVSPKPPWRKRKEDYLHHLRAETNSSTVLVSAADKLANVRTILSDYREIGEALWARFNGGREGTLWYYRALADTIATKVTSPLARELSRAVSELETLVQVSR